MPLHITLIRHGKSAQRVGVPIPGRQFRAWQARYDAAGIAPTSRPRADAIDATHKAAVLVSSDLRRAIDSASALAPGRACAQDALFREGELPSFGSGLRLPALAWAWAARAAWMLDLSPDAEPLAEARERAARAADRVESLARDHGSVALIGHGVMNGMIGAALRARGWQGPRRPASPHWSASRFERAG